MLAVQCRSAASCRGLLKKLESTEAVACIEAERSLLTKLEGGCSLPFGVNVHVENDTYHLHAFWKGEKSEALRIELAGRDPLSLADQAFNQIRVAMEKEVA